MGDSEDYYAFSDIFPPREWHQRVLPAAASICLSALKNVNENPTKPTQESGPRRGESRKGQRAQSVGMAHSRIVQSAVASMMNDMTAPDLTTYPRVFTIVALEEHMPLSSSGYAQLADDYNK